MEAQINGHNVLSEDIFRFDGNHIIEMWDLGQQIPDNMPNENGMFGERLFRDEYFLYSLKFPFCELLKVSTRNFDRAIECLM